MTPADPAHVPARLGAQVTRVAAHARRLMRGDRVDAAPHAVHVGIPDGETLWIAVDADESDTLALRDVATGNLTELPTETDPGTGRLRTARVSLVEHDRPIVGENVAVVVRSATHPDGVPVRYQPTPGPERTPRTRSGEWRFDVVTVDDEVRVKCTAQPPVAAIRSLGVSTALEVCFSAPEGVTPVVVGVGADGAVVGQVACDEVDDLLMIRIGLDSFDVAPGEKIDLVVDPDQRVPLVRANDDLRAPNAAVVLPSLSDDTDHDGAPELRYRKNGRLILTCPRGKTKAAP